MLSFTIIIIIVITENVLLDYVIRCTKLPRETGFGSRKNLAKANPKESTTIDSKNWEICPKIK